MRDFMAALIEASGLGRVLEDLPMTCLDVGARGGFTRDLLPIAPAVNAFGFEPDVQECERLNRAAEAGGHPWRSLRFVPIALAAEQSTRQLYIYRQRGCTSLFEADTDLAALYSRDDYFQLDGTAEVATMPLDEAASRYKVTDAAFLKIDIQGAELEVFSSGRSLLAGPLLAIRTEVSFVPIYKGQPLFADIDSELRRYGFVPMHFPELHHWRRTTKIKFPHLAEGPLPYSRGQMIHGDVLYFRHPETMPDDTQPAIERLLTAAFLAIVYEHIDHARAIFNRPAVSRHVEERYDVIATEALATISSRLARQRPRRAPFFLERAFKKLLRGLGS